MTKQPLTDPPDKLEPQIEARLHKWLQAKHPRLVKQGRIFWEECRDWHLKKGEQCANWEAAYRMWVRKHVEFQHKRRPGPGSFEIPQEHGPRGEGATKENGNVIALRDVLKSG